MEKTRFFFVVDKVPRTFSDGTILLPEVTAVFVESGGTECYAHVGQHAKCCIEWIREDTVPATPDQYAPLLKELCTIGYNPIAINQQEWLESLGEKVRSCWA